MVAYNVQSAVDTTNHLIVAHDVINIGTIDRNWRRWRRRRKPHCAAITWTSFGSRVPCHKVDDGIMRRVELRPYGVRRVTAAVKASNRWGQLGKSRSEETLVLLIGQADGMTIARPAGEPAGVALQLNEDGA